MIPIQVKNLINFFFEIRFTREFFLIFELISSQILQIIFYELIILFHCLMGRSDKKVMIFLYSDVLQF